MLYIHITTPKIYSHIWGKLYHEIYRYILKQFVTSTSLEIFQVKYQFIYFFYIFH